MLNVKNIALASALLVSTPSLSLAEDSMEALNKDVTEAAIAMKQAIDSSSKDSSLSIRLGSQFTIKGIEIGCGRLSVSADSVKTCLDALYIADDATGNDNTDALNSLRDRWRALQDLPEITTEVTWSTDVYNKGLRSSFDSLRAKCPPQTTSLAQDIACLRQQFETTYTYADTVKQTLGKSRIKADAGQRATINSYLLQVDKECTVDLGAYIPNGRLEDILAPAETIVEECLSQIHDVAYGINKDFGELVSASTGDYDNSDVNIRAMKEIAAAATNLQRKHTP